MTTDTVYKLASAQATVGGKTVNVTGIAKGAGMIQPNMATMLSFIFTDAASTARCCNRWRSVSRTAVSTASRWTVTRRPTTATSLRPRRGQATRRSPH